MVYWTARNEPQCAVKWCKGSLTVFLTLIFLLILSLLCSVMEAARLQGGRTQLLFATNAACESVFAAYDRDMLKKLNVFFFDGRFGGEGVETEGVSALLSGEMQEMIHPEDSLPGSFWNLQRMSLEECRVSELSLATDDGGMVFREEAITAIKSIKGIAFAETLLRERGWLAESEEKGKSYQREEVDNQTKRRELDGEKAQADQEKPLEAEDAGRVENPVTLLEEQKGRGLLRLVTPKDFSVSPLRLEVAALPRGRTLRKGGGLTHYSEDGLSAVLFDEYLMECFVHALSISGEESSPAEGELRYQLEYLLAGKESDAENLETVAGKLLLLREGVNYAYLLSDGVRVGEAAALAALLVGYTGIAPLVEATKHALLLSWAFGESVLDVKRLLGGKRVALVKSSANWQLSLDQVTQLSGQELREDEGGVTYGDYLRFLFLLEKQETLAERSLDLAEMRMRATEGRESFRMDEMACGMRVDVKAMSKSMFYVLPFMKTYAWKGQGQYELNCGWTYDDWR